MIVAAVAHYAEPAGFLHRLRRSLETVTDATVELDGRWHLMPGDELARWPSQVAKRAALMELAGRYGDWILVVDGDEYVEICDPDLLRSRLEETDLDVAEVTLRTLNRPWPLRELSPMQTRARRVYRAGTSVCGPTHYDYVRDGLRLNGDPARGRLAAALDLTDVLTVAHDNRNRGADRDQAAQQYRAARRRARVEVAA